MNEARAAYIGHQPADKDKCFPWPTRTHTLPNIQTTILGERSVREAREATLLNSREQQRRLFSLDYSARQREATGQQHKTQSTSCVLTKCFVYAASCHPGVSVAEMKQTLAQLQLF